METLDRSTFFQSDLGQLKVWYLEVEVLYRGGLKDDENNLTQIKRGRQQREVLFPDFFPALYLIFRFVCKMLTMYDLP